MAAPIKHKHREQDLRKFRNLFPEPKSLRVIRVEEYAFSEDGRATLATLKCQGGHIKFIIHFYDDAVEMSFLDQDDIEHRLCSLKRHLNVSSFSGMKEATIYLIDDIRRNLLE